MNSSISNSNATYKINLIVFFTIVIFIYILINSAGFILEYYQNQKYHSYSNDVPGKSELMKSIFLKSSPDIIFIGSSITKYHVSTNMFKKQKINVFNYGLESHFYTAYPAMIENAIKMHPKVIAITIFGPELYTSLLSIDAAFNKQIDVNQTNLKFFIQHYMKNLRNYDEAKLIIRLIQIYIEQLNYLIMNGYKFIDILKHQYEGYDPKIKLPTTDSMLTSNMDGKNKISFKQYLDCEAVGVTPLGFSCTNGDAVLLGNEKNLSYEDFNKKVDFLDKKFNYALISIFNSLIDKIRSADIKPVIIIIPQFSDPTMNIDLIKKSLHADVIDLQKFRIPKDGWFNGGHFNAKGRYIYSTQLVKKMKPLFRRGIHDDLSRSQTVDVS